MESHEDPGFDDFSVELEDFEYVQVKKWDRIFKIGEGGSFAQKPLVHDGTVYVGSVDHNVYAVDAKSGKMIWKFKTGSKILSSSPVESDGVIYIGSQDHNVYALNAADGSLVWKFRTEGKVAGIPCIDEGIIYIGSCDQNLYSINAKTGELIWKFHTQGEILGRATIHNGKILFGSYDHFLYCLDKHTGNLFWKHETQGDVMSFIPLLLMDGKVHFPSFDNYLRAVDIDTGKLIWKFLTGSFGGMSAGPVFYKEVLYVPNREGNLFALTTEGKELWKFSINHAMSHPLIHEDVIYFGTEDQNLYCLDMDGKVMWKFPTQGILWWKPTISGRNIYFVSWDCHLYCVNIDTHELVWKFRSQGEPSYAPPPFSSFELKIKKATDDSDFSDISERKTYDVGGLEEESTSEYKTRITYQVSTQYSSKGKYQIDSREEEF